MRYCSHYISSASLTLCSNHCCSFVNSPNRFTQTCGTTNKWYIMSILVYVKVRICWSQNLRFIYHINTKCLQNLRFSLMTNSGFCHHWNRSALDYSGYHVRMRSSCHTTSFSDVCRDPFKRHYRNRSGFFGYCCLIWRNNVHDDSPLKH